MLRCLMCLCLLAWCFASTAAPRCAPFEESATYRGTILDASLTDPSGPYLVWSCQTTQPPTTITRHCIEAPWGVIDLRRLGDRSETIRANADPVAAFMASYKRHVTIEDSSRCRALLDRLR